MWFGIDAAGHIVAFTSGGCGCVPEYVCRSKEETEQLEKFFLEQSESITEGEIEISANGSPFAEDALTLVRKGVYVYDVFLEKPDLYVIIAEPMTPLHIENLPDHIASILQSHVLENAWAGDRYLRVKHAY